MTHATDERIKLEEIIDALEVEIFIADDALGCVYQFWQSEEKKRINKSGNKIDGKKLLGEAYTPNNLYIFPRIM